MNDDQKASPPANEADDDAIEEPDDEPPEEKSCSPQRPCDENFSCVSGTCDGADTAPSISAITSRANGYFSSHITITGSDPNRDVESVQLVWLKDDVGNIWADSAEEASIPITDLLLTWQGDEFEINFEQRSVVAQVPGDVVAVQYRLLDATGNSLLSEQLHGAIGGPSATYVSDEGLACDLCNGLPGSVGNCGNSGQGYPLACSSGLHCIFSETAGEMQCADSSQNSAPVLADVQMSWQGMTPMLSIAGSDDSPGRLLGTITLTYADNNNGLADEIEEFAINWAGTTPNLFWSEAGSFEGGPQSFTAPDPLRDVIAAQLVVKDFIFPTPGVSAAVSCDWVTAP